MNAALAAVPSEKEPAIDIENLSKTYRIYDRPQDRLLQSFYRGRRHLFREHEALKPLTLTIHQGETVGIVGSNGSGKSTLLQIICGTLSATGGDVMVNGRISALLELGAGFNPEFTGKENVFLNASILGMSEEQTRAKYDDIVRFSGLEEAQLACPVKTYSSGMYVRLAFAVAIAVKPDILIVDEALAVGDEAFQRKCFARIRQLQEEGTAILFVSHASRTIIDLCSRAILLDEGELLMEGAPKDVIASYHKMIYAPPAEQRHIRAAIFESHRQGELSIASPEIAASTKTDPEEEMPESCVEYASNGGVISAPRLADEMDEPTRFLTYGKTYAFSYRVRFERDFSGLKFAMFIKTQTGQELAGAVLHAMKESLPEVKAGDDIEVSFAFPCQLGPGLYYLNCGVTTLIEGEDVFIHRLVDAAHFRVLPEESLRGDMEPRGLVDLDIKGSIKK